MITCLYNSHNTYIKLLQSINSSINKLILLNLFRNILIHIYMDKGKFKPSENLKMHLNFPFT